MARDLGVTEINIHPFLDGRDTPPTSAVYYLESLQQKIDELGCGRIATVVGRYYAMDRDKRWERTQRAYDLLVHGKGETATNAVEAVRKSYERGVTDEFVEPIAVTGNDGSPVGTINRGDSVIFFNFRPDRARQITRALAVPGFDEFDVINRPEIGFTCFTVYDRTFPLPIAFPPSDHKNVLAEVWDQHRVQNYR